MSTRYDPRSHAYDEQTRHAGAVYVLMLVVALAFGGFLWQLYSAPEIPRISAESGPYKIAPPPEAPADAMESASTQAPAQTASVTAEEAAVADAESPPAAGAPAAPPAAPHFVGNGPYVAQLAALQSEAAVDQAWRRLASRSPQLFAPARLDVQRADLGQRGIYYRVRAGYFADRTNASRFCDRVRLLGQDCIVVAR